MKKNWRIKKNFKLFTTSECMDIIELDGASNKGMNGNRNLIDYTYLV